MATRRATNYAQQFQLVGGAGAGIGGVGLMGADSTQVAESELQQTTVSTRKADVNNIGPLVHDNKALVRSNEALEHSIEFQQWQKLFPLNAVCSKTLLQCGEELSKDPRVKDAVLSNPKLQTLLFDAARERLVNAGYIETEEGCDLMVSPELLTQRLAAADLSLQQLEQAPMHGGEEIIFSPSIAVDEKEVCGQDGSLHRGNSLNAWSSSESCVIVEKPALKSDEYPGRGRKDLIPWKRLKDDYECAICLLVMVNPNNVDCQVGHSFCGDCVKKWLSKRDADATCPSCIHPISRVQPVFTLKQNIEKDVKCAEDCKDKEDWYKRYYSELELERLELERSRRHNEPSGEEDVSAGMGDEPPQSILGALTTVALIFIGMGLLRTVKVMPLQALMKFITRS